MTSADLPSLPRQSGCYLWHGAQERVIYVGKAIDLRSRVRSYFGRHAGAKAHLITRDAQRLEYIVTENEVEALILEANLIKRFQPHYNVLLKDDKSYPFLKLTNEPYPRLEFTRRVVKDGAQYFGPYPNPGVVRRVQELVGAVFPLRQNSGSPMQPRKKPCLRHHMGRCSAPCVGAADPEAYAAVVRQVRAFLEGRVEDTVAMLESEMRAAAGRLDFELARTYRDRLEALKRLTGFESNVMSSGGEDLDFLGVAQAGDHAMVQLFQMRRGRVIGRDKRFLTGAEGATTAELLEPFMAEYYGLATQVPPLVLLPDSDLDVATWRAFLAQRAGRQVELRTPQRGEKVALIGMAERNARTGLESELALLEKRGEAPGVKELQSALGLAAPPWRLEGFDISSLMGTHTVASLVVFEGGRAKKSEYRRMRIRGLDKPDDFLSMHQAVLRRFTGRLADQLPRPDLVLIDGGKGQLAAARRALGEAGVDVPLVGLAKRVETIVTESGRELLLPNTHPALRLLIHARDEAHRTAVGYNRQRRGQAMTRSLLDDVPGVGPKRRDALLAHFSSVDQLREADLDELAAVAGVGRAAAAAVKAYFDPAALIDADIDGIDDAAGAPLMDDVDGPFVP
ncbi:MAG: excinuclease ABC subunit UvrC [bacterium]|nr:excinuclease ABC subunit UvrC [bacterium]